MDAVTDRKYNIYFGGRYREFWTDNYRMSVVYEDRRSVEAAFDGTRWMPVGGDEELVKQLLSKDCPPLMQQYFQAAATAYAAAQDCVHRGLPLDKLYECFKSEGNSLVAPELMRLLLDDCGMQINMVYFICSKCCGTMSTDDVNISALSELQPRTAQIISLLRQTWSELNITIHDSRFEEYRKPFGAVRCGEMVTLRVHVMSGSVRHVFLVLKNDTVRREIPMMRNGEWYSASFPAPDTPQAMRYCFFIEKAESSYWLSPNESGYFGTACGKEEEGFRLTVFDKDFDTPAWFRSSVMYQVFPDRFGFSDDDTAAHGIEYHRSLGQTPELHKSLDEPVRWQPRPFEKDYSPDDFYGGTFKGIEGKLPYLKELGISCLYLNPIVEARSNHRYDTADYHRPDPILGSMEDFEHLCAEAEKQGIRIILDGVFSHTGADSRYFDRYGHYGKGGACSSESSEYYDWYDFKSYPDDYRCWWGFKDLPEVNELNPKWQSDIVTGDDSVVKLWLEHGAGGWRLDVADELPDEVLELIRTAAKGTKPDAPIIGEVWEDAVIKESYGGRRRYALGTALDSVMNYPFRRAVIDFALGRIDAYALRDFLIGQQMNYPQPMYYALMNLLGSHDVERLRSALATDVDIRSFDRLGQLAIEFSEERLEKAVQLEKLCAAIQFSVPGVPSVYYGDEQGMCGVCDPFNRLPFREDCRELHDYYTELAAMRNSTAVLSTGDVRFLAANTDVLIVVRFINDGKDVFGMQCDSGVYAAVINRGDASSYTIECKAANIKSFRGTIEANTAEIIKIK